MSSVVIASITESLPQFLSENTYSKIHVIVDEKTKRHCYPLVKPLLPKHTLTQIKSGEEEKNLTTCEKIWQGMTDAELDRHSLVINIGGGVIGDMGGFCASTYKRGIDFVQVPTTLLSQVDASVGGKLGIDFHGFKNHIGVFRIPNAVLIDAAFLKTLPERELRSGFAEIVKHCLIADAQKWQQIKRKDFAEQDFTDLITHSVEIKKHVVAQDPTEKGLRKILNFGHTLGHAIETFYLGKPKLHLLHGEAIAAGMICEAYISYQRGMIDEKALAEIEEFIFAVYGRATIYEQDIDAIIALTAQDKKNKGKEVRFSLLGGIGQCGFDIVVSAKEMKEALLYYI
ncbi:3-dehydroquinate synthase [Flectobacillus major]|uniref:3-dehydroquinate synthase n=1 Tax=Flectobacillus major TaxID=103 RepID=UPI00041D3C22|nr:3-dehydroquinate synthase [Flectobacillus major]